ncbi:hypothetical protein [Geminicoccus flavidas]|uniref:hypothetical protein n=1 Tax=Geminicoccus flavidas TaxID=2506407 RepID=UPI00135A60AE|nr:hypothetical protein [Geminicoccus flavidas]
MRSVFDRWSDPEQRALAAAMRVELPAILSGQTSLDPADAEAATRTAQDLLRHYGSSLDQIAATFRSPRLPAELDPWQTVSIQIGEDILVAAPDRSTMMGPPTGASTRS